MKPLLLLAALMTTLSSFNASAQTAPPTAAASAMPPAAAANAAVFQDCAAADPSHGVCPLYGVFGRFKLAKNNDVLDFTPSTTVPLIVNENYGWILRLNQTSGKVRVLERLTLPHAPQTWGTGDKAFGLSADRSAISMDVTLTVYNGTISKSWDVAKGDPAGRYRVSVYVGNAAPVEFEFDVIAP